MKDPKQVLVETLSERQAHNPAYSMRAFARDLSLSPQQLSNILNGRRKITPKGAISIAQSLGFSQQDTEIFCESSKAKFAKHESVRKVAEVKLVLLKARVWPTRDLELDTFKTISNWYPLALIELIKISRGKPYAADVRWYAKKLNITETEVKSTLSRLLRLKLISAAKKGWTVNQTAVKIDLKSNSEAIRNFHRQILEKANQALSFQTSEERYGTSSTLPFKIKNVALAKKRLQEFREKFLEEFADQNEGEEVYGLSMQFFNLTQTPKESKI